MRFTERPEPWSYVDEPYHQTSVRDANGQIVATVNGDSAETEDRARLISAAPDLLDCLKRAMPFVEAVYREHGRQYLENGGDALEEFAAAIAKAEGK